MGQASGGTARPAALTDPAARGPLTGRRAEVLALLRDAGAPLGVQDVADRTGLHRNTARFHLDGLVDDGLAERTAEQRAEPGRPRVLYVAHPDARSGVRSFTLLAEMLTGLVSAAVPDPQAIATEVGREWGRHLTAKVPPSETLSATESVRRLVELLGAVGFAPEADEHSGQPEVRLRHCPFREVAERHQDVVCALHLGLIRGSLEEMRAPVAARDLVPFVTPSLCVSHLEGAGATRRPGRSGAHGSAPRRPAPRARGAAEA